MPYIDEATLRTLWGDERVDEYFPTSAGLALAIDMAQNRVYSAIAIQGHADKGPDYYATVSAAPGLLLRASFIAIQEHAYSKEGLPVDSLLSLDELEIFERLRSGVDEIPNVDLDSTTKAPGGLTYTEKGTSDTSSSRRHARVGGRSQMYGNY